MRKRCVYCDKRPAKHPKEQPLFCTLRCALHEATQCNMDLEWCDKHGQWFNVREDGRCLECRQESRKEDP